LPLYLKLGVVMQEYIIDVSRIEELQTISNVNELDRIFERAKSTIVNGEKVLLVRKSKNAHQKFDEFSTLEELDEYKKTVYKYL
jgi:hypothetical protein